MFKKPDFLKNKLSEVSAKTLSLGGKQFVRNRNEKKVGIFQYYHLNILMNPR